jgi:hypothetical protein
VPYQPQQPGQPPYGQPPYGQPGQVYVPPPPPPTPPIDRRRIRPSLWWLATIPLPLIAGVAIAVVLIVDAVDTIDKPMQKFSAPGAITVKLKSGEGRSIYLRGIRFGSVSDQGDLTDRLGVQPSDLACRAQNVSGERSVNVENTTGFTITLDNDRYEAVKKFTADGAGIYNVSCRFRGDPTRPVPLALGPKVNLFGFVGSIFGVFAALIGGFLIAVTILVIVLVMRYQSKKRLQREALAAAGYGGQPPPPPAPPPTGGFPPPTGGQPPPTGGFPPPTGGQPPPTS